jgi:hypothetical protein
VVCSEPCRRIRRTHLTKLNRIRVEADPNLSSRRKQERGLEQVSRRDRQKILESFFTEVLTLEEEVKLIFSEASLMGSCSTRNQQIP